MRLRCLSVVPSTAKNITSTYIYAYYGGDRCNVETEVPISTCADIQKDVQLSA